VLHNLKKSPTSKIDGFVKSLESSFSVIPAKAGIQYFQVVLDACLRRHDGITDFLRAKKKIFLRYIGWREMSSKIHKTELELKQAREMGCQNPSQN
jgi:hypothetical protein